MSSDVPSPDVQPAVEKPADDQATESTAVPSSSDAPSAADSGDSAAPATPEAVGEQTPAAQNGAAEAATDSPPAVPAATEPPKSSAAETTPAQPAETVSSDAAADSAAGDQVEPAASETAGSGAAGQRQVKLQPQGAEQARAVPSVAADQGTDTSGSNLVPQSAAADPVELPSSDDLDAALEAEIAAAMNQELEAEPPAVAAEASAEAESAPAEALTEESLETGAKLKGVVQSVDQENVFVDVGLRSPGLVAARQFESGKIPEVGAQINVVVDKFDEAEGLIMLNVPRGRRRVGGNWDAVSVGQVVDCMVTKTNKGGLEVNVSSLRGFLPAAQIDLGYVADLEPYVGQKLTVQVLEVNPRKRNLIVSRRALMEAEREDAQKGFWESTDVGQTFTGRVKTIKDYGVFVDLGSVDGFLHIGEISWSRLKHPSDMLEVGQTVDVKVLTLDPERKRVGLGMRQLTQNPWNTAVEKYVVGKPVSGKVTRTTDFGAFVELEPGVEGLVHISELDHRRVNRVTEVLNVGQEVNVQVMEVDPERKRIGLSLKALSAAPQREPKPTDEDQAPGGGEPYVRKRKGSLRGGYGSGEGGGLFGNPSDFK